jgi:hypothetical protein
MPVHLGAIQGVFALFQEADSRGPLIALLLKLVTDFQDCRRAR